MKKTLVSLAAFLLGGTLMAQSHIVVNTTNGADHHYIIEGSGGLYFDNTGITVRENLNDGQDDQFDYADIAKITFTSTEGISAAEAESISLYPNPSQRFLFVNGAAEGSTMKIFNMMGAMVMETMVSGREAICIERLTPGIYVARIGSKSMKFVKR